MRKALKDKRQAVCVCIFMIIFALGFTAAAVWFLMKDMYAQMLLFALLRKPIEKLPAIPLSVISLAAFVLTYRIYYLDAELPHSFLLFILGFNTNFFSADYYPIIPWFFLFLSGAALGRYFKEGRVPKIF